MQIQPVTLHWFAQKQGLRLSREEIAADPGLCVRLGIRYLRSLQDRFGADLPTGSHGVQRQVRTAFGRRSASTPSTRFASTPVE